MTQTIDSPNTVTEPQSRAEAWLSGFEDALRARDVDRAAGMFATTSFWRDLIAFSWNITTAEGPAGVADLLTATLERTDPSGFATSEPADGADGVTTAWFTFETAVGRGKGLLRLVEEDGEARAWTFLTTMHELKGHEEPRGDRRPPGAQHGADKQRTTWAEHRQEEAESLWGEDPRRYSTTTRRFIGRNEHVTGIEIADLSWQTGADGKVAMREVPGTAQVLPADLVLLALGFLGPEPVLPKAFDCELDPRGNVRADADKMTTVPGVFAAGDCARGQSLGVWAIKEGRAAAEGVDRYLARV